jgi:hypothetical protein
MKKIHSSVLDKNRAKIQRMVNIFKLAKSLNFHPFGAFWKKNYLLRK